MKDWSEIEAEFVATNAIVDRIIAGQRRQLFIASLSAFMLGLGVGLYLAGFYR